MEVGLRCQKVHGGVQNQRPEFRDVHIPSRTPAVHGNAHGERAVRFCAQPCARRCLITVTRRHLSSTVNQRETAARRYPLRRTQTRAWISRL